jgi:trigger factor
MEVTLDTLSPVKKKITIVVPASRISEEMDNEYKELSKEVRIKGFRPGKVPRSHLQKMYGKEVEGRVVFKLINDSYSQTIDENKIEPVGEPEVEAGEMVLGEDYTFTASFEIKPEFEAEGYKGLKLEREKIEITDEMVDLELAKLRERMATLEPVEDDRKIEDKDIVILDYKGYEDGMPVENLASENAMVEVGSEQPFPGYSIQLVGAKKGDELDITINFTDDFPRTELQGKKVMFVSNIKEIKTKVVPELDDEFAQGLGEFETLDKLRETMREDLEKYETGRANMAMHEQIIESLREKNQISLPPSLVDSVTENVRRSDEMRKAQAAQSAGDEAPAPSEDEEEPDYESQARNQVQWLLILDKIARAEDIIAETPEIESEYYRLQNATGLQVEQLKQIRSENDVASEIVAGKVFNFIIENGDIEDRIIEPNSDK